MEEFIDEGFGETPDGVHRSTRHTELLDSLTTDDDLTDLIIDALVTLAIRMDVTVLEASTAIYRGVLMDAYRAGLIQQFFGEIGDTDPEDDPRLFFDKE